LRRSSRNEAALTRPVAATMLGARFTFHASSMAISTRALSLHAGPLRPPCYIPPPVTHPRSHGKTRVSRAAARFELLAGSRLFGARAVLSAAQSLTSGSIMRGATTVNRTLLRRKSSGKRNVAPRLVAACGRRPKQARGEAEVVLPRYQ